MHQGYYIVVVFSRSSDNKILVPEKTVHLSHSDCPAVYHNLKKARRLWGIIARVLARTGEMMRACGMVYKEVA